MSNPTSSSSHLAWPSPTHGDALKSKGTIRYEIKRFAEFANSPNGIKLISQPAVFIRGLPWHLTLTVKKVWNSKWLNCYAFYECDNSIKLNTAIKSGIIRILAQREGKKDIVKVHTGCLIEGVGSYIEPIERVLNPENGWYDPEKDTIILEAEFNVELPRDIKNFTITAREVERTEMLKNRMKNLLIGGREADVHFMVGDKKERFAAHKGILLSASDVFDKMFIHDEKCGPSDNPIEVPDVEAEAFRIMLSYIYTEDPEELNWYNLFDVFIAAKKYNVIGLVQACADCLDYLQLDSDNVLFVLGHAQLHDEKSLVNRCWSFVDQNVYAVVLNENFLKIDHKLLDELLGRDTLKMSKKPKGEIALWNAAIRWADEQCRQKDLEFSGQNQRQMLGTALFNIRVPLIGEKDLAEIIAPSAILTKEELATVGFYQLNPAKFPKTIQMLNLGDQYQLKFPTGKRG